MTFSVSAALNQLRTEAAKNAQSTTPSKKPSPTHEGLPKIVTTAFSEQTVTSAPVHHVSESSAQNSALSKLQNYNASTAPKNTDIQIQKSLAQSLSEQHFTIPPLNVDLSKFQIKPGCSVDVKTSSSGIRDDKVTCWSSRQMSKLINWRNPAETPNPSIVRSIINIAKKGITEVCLPLLTVTATIEAIAYKTLIKASSLSPRLASLKELEPKLSSARFTMLWTIANLWANISDQKLLAEEEKAKSLLYCSFLFGM